VWSVPSGFNELRDVAEMSRKQSSELCRSILSIFRSYWKRHWAILNPLVEPVEISSNGEGEVVVKVHQVVRDPKGNLLADRMVILS
jgi:hypothetical protein